MLKLLNKSLRRFCCHFWPIYRRSVSRIVTKRFGKSNPEIQTDTEHEPSCHHLNSQLNSSKAIRIATFNAALFSRAPAVPKAEKVTSFNIGNGQDINKRRVVELKSEATSPIGRPKSILKQSPQHPNSMSGSENLSKRQKFAKSRLRVSINLPDNEISLLRRRQLSFQEGSSVGRILNGKIPLRSTWSFDAVDAENCLDFDNYRCISTIYDVLREIDADIVALQNVKAEEGNAMKPLSDLAQALGMNYVFAESWAPEYGNAVLSRLPIKRSKVQKIFDDTDFRNVLKVTVDVPRAGEVNFYCTHLDHLDESWRMKQINAIIQSNNEPHILAGGLNSLDVSDYSLDRWTDIVKYYEEMGKPTPKVEVMKNLKTKQYTDAKDFAGECESVVMIAKGQSVQGTCKYGTRVDYILSSPNSPYKFVPGSYSVLSSKGTSDHHIVKVDMVKVTSTSNKDSVFRHRRQRRRNDVKIKGSSLPRDAIDAMTTPYDIGLIRAFSRLESKWEHLCADLYHGFPSAEISDVKMLVSVVRIFGGPELEMSKRVPTNFSREKLGWTVSRLWPNLRYMNAITTVSMKQYYPKFKNYCAYECAHGVAVNLDIKQLPLNFFQ